MDRTEHLRRLRAMLSQVAPQSQLESLGDQPQLEAHGLTEQDFDLATSGLRALNEAGTLETTAETITDEQMNVLEAIILPRERPVVDVINNTFRSPPKPWGHLGRGEAKKRLQQAIPSIGRIELPNHPQIPYGGTGFVVGPNLLMTNRHVAEIFASGLGRKNLMFKPGQSAGIDFKQEARPARGERPRVLLVRKVVMIHPFWDMALLQVDGLPDGHPALALSTTSAEDLDGQDIAIIGYPAQDPRNQVGLQNRIFRSTFNVKRLQPGKLKQREALNSFGHRVDAVTHDASTLGGNSGSAVVHVATGQVIALHFAGIYLKANYAVPTFELARDNRVVDQGVNFAKPVPEATNDWRRFWDVADGGNEETSAGEDAGSATPNASIQAAPVRAVQVGQATTWTIPLQVTVTLGTPTIAAGVPAVVAAAVSTPAALDEGLFGKPSQAVIDEAYSKFSVASLGDPGFGWANALNAADASHLAYQGDSAVTGQALSKWRLDTCDPFHIGSTDGFVASSPNAILVSFRGTAQAADWLANLKVVASTQPYGTVHRGFLMAFRSVKQRLEELLESIGTDGREVILTGHSLGGAIAAIAAAEWHERLPVSAVYTYGQPAVGRRDFRTFMNQNYAESFFRFVNDDDIVPRIPPGYVHFGKLFHFSPRGRVSNESLAASGTEEDTPTMTADEFRSLQASLESAQSANTTEGVGLEGFFPSFSDHGIVRYLGQILKQL